MGLRDQDSGSTASLAGLLLRGRSAPRPEPAPDPEPTRPGSGPGQMSLLFSPPPATPARIPQAAAVDYAPALKPLPASSPVAPGLRRPSGEQRVWTVRALVGDVRQTVEADYSDVAVQGEISNFRPAASGHLYFTLKDGDAQLSVVLFRRQAQLLRFAPRDGLEVLARGRVSLYDSRGQLQLIAETLQPRGTGSLQLVFEQLKAKLLAEGLFEQARKRPLPRFPQCIGILSSPTGAVIHDIIRVVRRRHACLDLLLYPVAAQGPECAPSVVEGLRWFNSTPPGGRLPHVDLILIARGGGSLEDLAGFNDEALARAIAASALPVVSAIGHETDFTIADFVADLRAPTPSAAAELITTAQHRIEERVHSLADRLTRAIRYQLILRSQRFSRLSAVQMHSHVRHSIDRRNQRLDDLRRRLDRSMLDHLQRAADAQAAVAQRLARREPERALLAARSRLDSAQRGLAPAIGAALRGRRARLHQAEARLSALSPLAVLARGYALVYAPDGNLLRDAAQVAPGERILARIQHGTVAAEVLPRPKPGH